jgi:hypothetical protein
MFQIGTGIILGCSSLSSEMSLLGDDTRSWLGWTCSLTAHGSAPLGAPSYRYWSVVSSLFRFALVPRAECCNGHIGLCLDGPCGHTRCRYVGVFGHETDCGRMSLAQSSMFRNQPPPHWNVHGAAVRPVPYSTLIYNMIDKSCGKKTPVSWSPLSSAPCSIG